jgi:hypothetical protein
MKKAIETDQVTGSKVLVIEYLYQAQFALKQYGAFMIQ